MHPRGWWSVGRIREGPSAKGPDATRRVGPAGGTRRRRLGRTAHAPESDAAPSEPSHPWDSMHWDGKICQADPSHRRMGPMEPVAASVGPVPPNGPDLPPGAVRPASEVAPLSTKKQQEGLVSVQALNVGPGGRVSVQATKTSKNVKNG